MTEEKDPMEKCAAELGAVAYAIHKMNDHHVIQGGVDTSFKIMSIANPKGGSVRYTRPDTKEVIVVEPGDRMFATATMLAEEYFNGERWIKAGDLGDDSEWDK